MKVFPRYRVSHLSRLRRTQALRHMIGQAAFSPKSMIMPYFVTHGRDIRIPISSMPGVYRLSVDRLVKEARAAKKLGIGGIILFGIPKHKDASGTEAYAKDGIVQRAVRAIKQNVGGFLVVTDVCLCEYTNHGHCAILKHSALNGKRSRAKKEDPDFRDKKRTLEALAKTALSHAQAGADMVAPSAMMDGQVASIRSVLDQNGYAPIPIMAYSVKYASAFYGPFREAAGSAPQFGHRFYQMDPANNTDEVLRRALLELKEGADIVMVKPALAYLDIIRRVKETFAVPLAAFNVSAEYSMVKAAAAAGWIEEKKIVWEILTGIRRAGADIILTYHACDVARWIQKGCKAGK